MEDVGEVALEAAGLRAVVVVDVADVVDLGFGAAVVDAPDIAEVRRAAVPRVEVRRLSSSDTEDVERCADEAAVVDGRLAAVELAAGRVGGLLSPPVAELVRVADELEVGFAVVELVAGRRAVVVVAGFLVVVEVPVLEAVVVGFLVGAAAAEEDLGFSAGASAPTAGASTGDVSVPEASVGASAGASSCWTTSYPSASDIVGLGALN